MRNSAGKGKIREALRKIFDEAGGNPPNMNRAWDLLKVVLLGARRSRFRDVLREPEFAPRRPRPGRRANPRPSQPTPAQDTPVAILKQCSFP
jgi:hypothetical protein